VARNGHGHGVRGAGARHGAGRRRLAEGARHLAVAAHFAARDGAERLPHPLLEAAPGDVEGQRQLRRAAVDVAHEGGREGRHARVVALEAREGKLPGEERGQRRLAVAEGDAADAALARRHEERPRLVVTTVQAIRLVTSLSFPGRARGGRSAWRRRRSASLH
jgi:hypothetical protein